MSCSSAELTIIVIHIHHGQKEHTLLPMRLQKALLTKTFSVVTGTMSKVHAKSYVCSVLPKQIVITGLQCGDDGYVGVDNIRCFQLHYETPVLEDELLKVTGTSSYCVAEHPNTTCVSDIITVPFDGEMAPSSGVVKVSLSPGAYGLTPDV